MSNPAGTRPDASPSAVSDASVSDAAEADRMEQQTPAFPEELSADQPRLLAAEADEGDLLEQSIDVPLDSEDGDYPPDS